MSIVQLALFVRPGVGEFTEIHSSGPDDFRDFLAFEVGGNQ